MPVPVPMPDRYLLGALALALVSGACNSGTPAPEKTAPTKSEASARVEVTPPTPGPAPLFSTLTHIAGRGELDREGESLWKPEFEGKPATDVELSRPYFAMADAAGHIYVADKEAHAVRRIKLDGTLETWAGTGKPGDDGDAPRKATESQLDTPNGLWVLPSAMVFVLDLGNSKVRRILPDGTMTTLLTVKKGIDTGRGLWVAPDMNLAYVASKNELLRWEPDAGVSVLADGFSNLGNILVDLDGSVLVCDRGGDRVFSVSPAGEVKPLAGSGEPGPPAPDGTPALKLALDGPRGLARLGDKTLIIATHESGQLWAIDPDGKGHQLYDPSPSFAVPFEITGPRPESIRGLSLTPDGDLILTHGNEGVVQRLEAAPPSAD